MAGPVEGVRAQRADGFRRDSGPAFVHGPYFFSMDFSALRLAGAGPLEGRVGLDYHVVASLDTTKKYTRANDSTTVTILLSKACLWRSVAMRLPAK